MKMRQRVSLRQEIEQLALSPRFLPAVAQP